jgi:hypothetical protein
MLSFKTTGKHDSKKDCQLCIMHVCLTACQQAIETTHLQSGRQAVLHSITPSRMTAITK